MQRSRVSRHFVMVLIALYIIRSTRRNNKANFSSRTLLVAFDDIIAGNSGKMAPHGRFYNNRDIHI